MPSRSLFWHIFPYTLLFASSAALVIFFVSVKNQERLFYVQTQHQLQSSAELMLIGVQDEIRSKSSSAIQDKIITAGAKAGTRFTVIASDGTVLADSASPIENLDNHKTRPEIEQALDGQIGIATRYSVTLKKRLMYVAVPVRSEQGRILGVVRASMDADSLARELGGVFGRNLFVLFVVISVAGLATWYRTRSLANALRSLRRTIRRIAKGELQTSLEDASNLPKEVGGVVDSVREIANLYDSTLYQVFRKEIELDGILRNMSEGVVATDSHGRITHLNHAAARILEVNTNKAKGVRFVEIIRIPDLENFIQEALESGRAAEMEMVLHRGSTTERTVIVRASAVLLKSDQPAGAVFVFLDITDLRRLERHRQEFVSNVSHELKTPLTTIKGFAETMQDPLFSDLEQNRKYSRIIQKHADRLSALIDDLLQLSKLEKDQQSGQIDLGPVLVDNAVATAVEVCQSKARDRGVRVQIGPSTGVRVLGSSTLLEQALINLLDNAIKHSSDGGRVEVSTRATDQTIEISVKDYGSGIPADAIPRLFERFYRVDAGRSREMGGTGLGLSIVKHIAIIHRGEIGVESEVGQGSRFFLTIPRGSHQNLIES